MRKARLRVGQGPGRRMRTGLLLIAFAGCACIFQAAGRAQDASGKPQAAPAKPDSAQSEEIEAPAATLPATSTPEERNREAWAILTDAAGDANRTQTRLQALAALGLLRSPRSSKMIAAAMTETEPAKEEE